MRTNYSQFRVNYEKSSNSCLLRNLKVLKAFLFNVYVVVFYCFIYFILNTTFFHLLFLSKLTMSNNTQCFFRYYFVILIKNNFIYKYKISTTKKNEKMIEHLSDM